MRGGLLYTMRVESKDTTVLVLNDFKHNYDIYHRIYNYVSMIMLHPEGATMLFPGSGQERSRVSATIPLCRHKDHVRPDWIATTIEG